MTDTAGAHNNNSKALSSLENECLVGKMNHDRNLTKLALRLAQIDSPVELNNVFLEQDLSPFLMNA